MIPKPTEADANRDAEADYEFVRKYERKGDAHAMACAYIRLTQSLRKLNAAMAERIQKQSELLSNRAEKST